MLVYLRDKVLQAEALRWGEGCLTCLKNIRKASVASADEDRGT
jgi:hypothetical protein